MFAKLKIKMIRNQKKIKNIITIAEKNQKDYQLFSSPHEFTNLLYISELTTATKKRKTPKIDQNVNKTMRFSY